MDTPARLLRLLAMFTTRPSWNAEDLAARLEVTTRTLRRDVTRLRDLGYPARQIEIAYLVTIGSPLGLQVVKEKIRRERWDNKVRTPSVVTRRWVNFADLRDPVVVDTCLANDYAPNSPSISVQDDLVLNDYHRGVRQNPHKSYGYLRTPEMSRLIAEFLELTCT